MDFFQGLKNIYEMTEGVETELRIDLEKSTGEKGYGVWQSFSHSEPLNYTIQIGTYSGTIGNTKTQNDVLSWFRCNFYPSKHQTFIIKHSCACYMAIPFVYTVGIDDTTIF